MSERRPGVGRYAHPEREQRWRVRAVPEGAKRVAEIHDWYVQGARLRLRRVDDGRSQLFKLAQKVRSDPGDPETVSLTNMYLDPAEFELLRRQLPGRPLHKTRWRLTWADRHVAVDQFHGPLSGLVLAETQLAPGEERLAAPPFAVDDVTNDDRFSGGSLAFATDDDIEALHRLLQQP